MEYITDKETYLKVKEIQKKLGASIRNNSFLRKAENIALREYKKLPQEDQTNNNWALLVTKYTQGKDYEYLDKNYNPRTFNIFYSIIKGRSYIEVEAKVKKDNAISKYAIEELIKEFNVDQEKFWIGYEGVKNES